MAHLENKQVEDVDFWRKQAPAVEVVLQIVLYLLDSQLPGINLGDK